MLPQAHEREPVLLHHLLNFGETSNLNSTEYYEISSNLKSTEYHKNLKSKKETNKGDRS